LFAGLFTCQPPALLLKSLATQQPGSVKLFGEIGHDRSRVASKPSVIGLRASVVVGIAGILAGGMLT